MSSLRLLLATVAVLIAVPASSALAAPANDARANAQVVSPQGQTISASTTGATVTYEDQYAPGDGTHSVWYRWTAPQNGMVTITTSALSFDPLVGVYEGSSGCCATFHDLDSGAGDDAQLSFYVRAGAPYDILVNGETAGAFGSFTLKVAFDSTPPAPANDDFADAHDLGSGTSADPGPINGLFATGQLFEPNHRGASTKRSLWYRWTPAKSGGTRISVECRHHDSDVYGTDDPIVAVYTGGLLNTLSEVPYTDTKWLYDCTRDYVQFNAVAGTTYRIAIDAGAGQIGESGPLWLKQDTTPPTVAFDGVSTYGPNQAVKWTESENATTKCKLDDWQVTTCSNDQFQLVNAPAGTHTLEVWPTDSFGNPGPSSKKTFTVTTATPNTQITGGPPAVYNKAETTLTFSGGAGYECRYPTKQWFACDGGSFLYKYYFGKTDDVTFEVRAKNAYGNVDPTPAARTWKYDFAAPKMTFPYVSPKAASGQAMTWTWSADEKATFECSVDGAPFAPCTSPHTVAGVVGPASRTIKVRATDVVGNVSETARTGYQAGPPPAPYVYPNGTGTTSTTTSARTTTLPPTTGSVSPVQAIRWDVRPAVSRTTRKRLAREGLRVRSFCRPSCVVDVTLMDRSRVLARVRTRGGTATLKLGRSAKSALKKVRKGRSLQLLGRSPGGSSSQSIRIVG